MCDIWSIPLHYFRNLTVNCFGDYTNRPPSLSQTNIHFFHDIKYLFLIILEGLQNWCNVGAPILLKDIIKWEVSIINVSLKLHSHVNQVRFFLFLSWAFHHSNTWPGYLRLVWHFLNLKTNFIKFSIHSSCAIKTHFWWEH